MTVIPRDLLGYAIEAAGAAWAVWVGTGALARRYRAPRPALPASGSIWMSPRTDILTDPVFRVIGLTDDFGISFSHNGGLHIADGQAWQRIVTNYNLTEIR